MTAPKFHDSLYRLAQIGTTLGVQLVRLTGGRGDNQYDALPVEFDSNGETQVAENQPLTVLNLAEPADEAGELPPGTEAVAIDVEGKWVIFVRESSPGVASSAGPARITALDGGPARYQFLWQEYDGQAGLFSDIPSGHTLVAINLAELSFGRPAAVDVGTFVLVQAITDTSGIERYVFDHPAYAKYLD